MADESDVTSTDPTAEIESAMAEARARLADVPAEIVVTNHAMGLFELGAIHLSSQPPDLASAALAIDAMAAIVDGLGDRLGDDAQTMRDALANIRMAFVSVKSQSVVPAGDDSEPAGDDSSGADDADGVEASGGDDGSDPADAG